MRTIEPSTKGLDDCSGSGGGGAGGAELFLLLGTSDEGSLGRALLETRELEVDVFLLGVAILASPPRHRRFRSHRPAASGPLRPAPARTTRRATPPASPPCACAVPARRRQRAAPPRPQPRAWAAGGDASAGAGGGAGGEGGGRGRRPPGRRLSDLSL